MLIIHSLDYYQVTVDIAQDLLSHSLSTRLILWSAEIWTYRILLTFRSSGSRKGTPTSKRYLLKELFR